MLCSFFLSFFACLNNSNTVGTEQKQQGCTHAPARSYLQSDVGPGQTASSAEADLHVVKPTVSLGDVSDLNVTATLGLGLACRKPRRESDRK